MYIIYIRTLEYGFIKLILHLAAVVLSPSQDSFYNTIPGMITVEEGATPSSQSTEHLMNTYFQPSVLPNEQRNGNAKNGHLLTSTASATVSIGTRVGMDGSRVDDNKIKEQSYTGAMAHTSHSTLPISPSEPSAKEASTVEILSSNSHQSILTGEGRVEQPLRNDSRNTGHQFHFPQPEQQMSSASSKANKGEMNYKQLMQGSISQGMPGIMNKVINENKDNTVPTSAQSMVSVESKLQTGRAMVHAGPDKQASPSQIKARYYSTRMGHKREGKRKVASESMVLRTLVCSPMVTASRKFPEFVFTPGAASQSGESGTNSTKVKISTDGKENRMHSSQMVQSNVSTSTVTKTEDEGQLIGYKEKEKAVKRSKGDTKLNLLARKLEFDYENDQTKFKSHSLKTRVHGQSDSKLDGKSIVSQAPYAHHCTATRSVLPVTAETTLTVPFKYHCRASLYPTFLRSAYYSTEMDIMESLHTLLDMKFKPQHPHVQENQPSNQVMSSNESPMPSTESLMDEARKSHLIFSSETPKKAKSSLKRPHSFHYRRTDSSESSNLESPTKRELLMRKAAEAVKQRTKKAFSETEFDLDTVLKQQTNKPGRLNARQVQGSDDYAKSMENLTMTDTRRTLPGLNPYSQKLFSSSSYSLQGLPTRHASFREHPSSRTSSNYTNHHNALPKRSKSFHESSKSSQSMEALHIISGPFCKEEGDEELLYTFERKRRPVTVLVRSTSSLSVNQSQTAEEAKSQPAPQANSHPSNLMTMKAISSQGLALSEFAENQSNHSKFTEGTGSQKRFSRNRPTSAPAERAPHSSGSSGDNGRESSRLDGLMTSIYLKSDKLWWHEF